jgi:Fic-DOC domain mobile mystery protein B
MNAIPGATLISLEDTDALIPDLATQQQLNEWEQQNIAEAQDWAFNARVLKRSDPLDEVYLRQLHRRMFGRTWRWAGTYRRRDGINIGCPFVEIYQRVPTLLGDVRYWIENQTFDIDEIAVRFHHRLVWQIHAFPNGNGRHARMMADVLVAKHGRPVFTWGPVGGDLVNEGDVRRAYLEALRALDADDRNVKSLLEFARK